MEVERIIKIKNILRKLSKNTNELKHAIPFTYKSQRVSGGLDGPRLKYYVNKIEIYIRMIAGEFD